MQQRHKNRQVYFQEQAYTSNNYVIPFIEDHLSVKADLEVLEIGCGEGGNLSPFLDRGCRVTGIDMDAKKITNARTFFQDHKNADKLRLINQDIYEIEEDLKFDLIIMRDVLEHIHNQEKFMHYVKKFLKEDALFFLGFPPWQNPSGGHQQMCDGVLSKVPYIHILPRGVYKFILKSFGEEKKINSLLEIKDTGITIERFKRILKAENYKVLKEVFYLINPNYDIKFGVKPKEQIGAISKIPLLRNFVTTTCYYLISK